MPLKPIELPPAVARRFVDDMRAFHFEPNAIKQDEIAARKLVELANALEPVQYGRIYIEKINGSFLFELKGPAEYKAGLERAIAKGWLYLQESGTYVRFTDAGAALFRLSVARNGGCAGAPRGGELCSQRKGKRSYFTFVHERLTGPRSPCVQCASPAHDPAQRKTHRPHLAVSEN